MKTTMLVLLAAAAAGFGATLNPTVPEVTAQQVILDFKVTDSTQCTVQVFTDAARKQPIDDTNELLFPGSTACTRAGSVANGTRVRFVVGLRTSQKAADGLMHSRSLAVLTPYYYSI